MWDTGHTPDLAGSHAHSDGGHTGHTPDLAGSHTHSDGARIHFGGVHMLGPVDR
jgi:hypothetical protein